MSAAGEAQDGTSRRRAIARARYGSVAKRLDSEEGA